ncbi:uncharacterized protein LOC115232346 isoform X1 [Octopus sinensis]|uniref:Uncharacterized protein LOC115232346 isoform X1 n=1 Tax=Octopus sinensis TaxID=2607531 RepID=A0A6P7U258_9MOLL|nr:uncharacterized protein LOC115232346 isoform X1 [Octopus sinensis]
MATSKRRGKMSKKSKIVARVKESHEHNKQRKFVDENDKQFEEKTNGSLSCQVSYMSLDVLAQVAADKLRDDEKLRQKSTSKKISKRSIQCLDILNLEQIQSLSDKTLLNLFSEITCNEMTRNFTYQCYLIPEKCQEKFTSFGNETKAKMHMKQHLINHIDQLVYEANDPERKYRFIFTAEPVHVRKRKLSEEKAKKKRSTNYVNCNPLNGSNINCSKNIKTFTNLKATKEISRENKMPTPKRNAVDMNGPVRSTRKNNLSEREIKQSNETVKNVSSPKKVMAQHNLNKETKLKKSPKCKTKRVSSKSVLLANEDELKFVSPQVVDEAAKNEEGNSASRKDIVKKIDRNNEEFILDLLKNTHPHHDHCYTTISGKKCLVETCSVYSDNEEDNSSNHSADVEDSSTLDSRPLLPILELDFCSEDIPSVASEEIVDSSLLTEDEDSLGHCGYKPYPPMPKSALAKKGKLQVPEENESLSEGEAVEYNTPCPKKKKKDFEKNTAAELERKTALRCIRELKGRKKDDKIALACQICLDKTFTASATLMYHYRSHAGIKPFVCLLCSTTFTRQHSLNYHMLIHNNQSRFTCKDCGRKFRHPSHFKEHLRRHTGETPFECKDCPQKFKTRNTYKRHLKTRHGKLLTAAGIHVLSKEEFLKVRTKPYKKYYTLKHTESVKEQLMPELGDSQLVSPCSESVYNPVPTTSNNASNFTNTIEKPSTAIINSTDNSFYIPFEISVNS